MDNNVNGVMNNEWMTTTQAGRVLGLTRQQVGVLARAGVLKSERIHRMLMLIKADSVEQEAQRRGIEVEPQNTC